jgi:hypothetical protein
VKKCEYEVVHLGIQNHNLTLARGLQNCQGIAVGYL